MKKYILSLLILLSLSSPALAESVYDRVIKTGVIRCGYVTYPPAVMKNPNTGAISGIYPDVMNKLAETLSLKVEWTEEATWATAAEGVVSGRYDMFCSAGWPNGARARVVDFSDPFYYSSIDAYVRADEARFKNVEDMNKPDVKFSAIDGSTILFMTKEIFPQAGIHPLVENTSHAEMIMDVQLKKADAVLAERSVAHDFMKNNPGAIKRFNAGLPLVANPSGFLIKKDEAAFANMINTGIHMLLNQGTVERILKSYEPEQDQFFYRVAKPYSVD